MNLLERARKSISTSIESRNSISAQSHALDSIACSLLHIAENMNSEAPQLDTDKVELIVRRLLDDAKAPTVKKPKATK